MAYPATIPRCKDSYFWKAAQKKPSAKPEKSGAEGKSLYLGKESGAIFLLRT